MIAAALIGTSIPDHARPRTFRANREPSHGRRVGRSGQRHHFYAAVGCTSGLAGFSKGAIAMRVLSIIALFVMLSWGCSEGTPAGDGSDSATAKSPGRGLESTVQKPDGAQPE